MSTWVTGTCAYCGVEYRILDVECGMQCVDCKSEATPCNLNYEEEYYMLQRRTKELTEENERYRQALLNLCLKLK